MIKLTENAQHKIAELLAEEKNPNAKLRMYIEGGGCSGFSYGFSIEDSVADDDHHISFEVASVLIDPISAQYLEGVVIDFKTDIQGARFTISNPKAVTTCGCGNSFSPF